METIKRLFFKFMLLASTHCTMVVGVDAHFTTAPFLNPIHSDIWMGLVVRESMGLSGDTCYTWLANGMLGSVLTPEGKTVYFGYDTLGRRVSKTVEGTVRRYGWDGNVLLHEWEINEKDRPRIVKDDIGREVYNGTEKPENLVTWVYDGTSFTPVAKVTEDERYTIIHDYLGTPTQAYDSNGELVWEMVLDVYGEVNECNGDRTLIPFRYQGQYEEEETNLYYNRFRYYSPQMGMYISQDPIGLAGNNPTLYGYVEDTNIWLDVLGLFPKPNKGIAPQHGGFGHNERIDKEIANLKLQGAENIRKNQQQVDFFGNVVGRNKPDIQYNLEGVHYNVEYDTSHKSSLNHQKVLHANDKNARNTFWEIDRSGKIITGSSTCS